MQPQYQQIHRILMGCFLPLTSTTKKVPKYKKHYSRQYVIRELTLIAAATYPFVRNH